MNTKNFYPDYDSSEYELEVKTGTEILDDIYLPKHEIISGILPRGTYLLGGASKTGKSFMVLQLAYHISKGIPVCGRAVRKGTVLYLALEDNEKRLQRRMCQMFGAENVDNVYFATKAATISGGLEEQIRDFLNQHTDTSLVIIDTLQKVREYDRGSYADDYAVISAVKNITDARDLAIIIVHHVNKQKHDDPMNELSGTTALSGAADGSYLLKKDKRESNNATLKLMCRDLPEKKIKLIFNRQFTKWELDSIEDELWIEKLNPLVERVIKEVLGESEIWSGTASEIIMQLGCQDMRTNVVSRKISCSADALLTDYRIKVEFSRSCKARTITLRRLPAPKRDDDANDANDANSYSGYLEKSASFSSEGITDSQMVIEQKNVALTDQNVKKSTLTSREELDLGSGWKECDDYAGTY
ncbi:MAG: AAA family ATPase [Clostridiales bacterium]|nr:AAA family ATPase [Candidatus Crickella caballi]